MASGGRKKEDERASELDARGWEWLHVGLSLGGGAAVGRGHLHGRAATGQLWLTHLKGCVSKSQR